MTFILILRSLNTTNGEGCVWASKILYRMIVEWLCDQSLRGLLARFSSFPGVSLSLQCGVEERIWTLEWDRTLEHRKIEKEKKGRWKGGREEEREGPSKKNYKLLFQS